MTNILLLTSSPRGAESLSSRFAIELAEGLRERTGGTLIRRDLAENGLPHITPAYIQGRMAPTEGRTQKQSESVELAQELVDELKMADIIVIASAMINFGIPSQLKAWFDHVIWPGVTFGYDESGAKGLLKGKKVHLVTAAGGVFSEGNYASFDFQTKYLLHLLGFIGLTDVETIIVEGTVLGADAALSAIAKAETQVKALLSRAA